MTADPLSTIRWPLRTERLAIRRAEPGDAAAVFAYHRQDGVFEWMMFQCSTWEDFQPQFVIPERLAHRLIVEWEGRIIGDLKLAIGGAWAQESVQDEATNAEAEVGWIFDPRQHGHGYAREAVRSIIGSVFGHTPVRRVVAQAFADNTSSVRLMEALGMRREGHFRRESLHRTRGWIDGVTYAVLKEEWEASG